LRRQRPLLDVVEFGYAVLDEAQFIKNPDAKVAQACYSIRAHHRIALTGTPLENRQLDLWSNFHFLMPGLLGRRESFERHVTDNGERATRELRTLIGPFLLRRTKQDVATELPPKTLAVLPCPLTDAQRVEYARICEEGLRRLGEDLRNALKERSFGVFALLTRLRQVCCDPSLLPWVPENPGQSGKINALCDIVGDLFAAGHKVVVFSQFVSLLRRVDAALQAAYPQVPRYAITGATPDRTRPVVEFQGGSGAAAMLVSLKAAGTGITLHAADYVFLLDPWWNPAVEEQAIDRVHRIGQTRNVFVYRLIAPGTIEERIQVLQAGKRELFRQVVDGIPAGLDLVEHFHSLTSLIRLSEDAE
jgi:SNF2 family DNA or RNA helicase